MVPVAARTRLSVHSVLGAPHDGLVPPPGTASPHGLFGPRGVWVDERVVIAADTGNHRVLVWRRRPGELPRDAAAADVVLGQAGPGTDGRNRNGTVGPDTMWVPTSVVVVGDVLVVADSWNHRLLFWPRIPERDGEPASWVWGQPHLRANNINQGTTTAANTLYWPYGLATDGRRLLVADTGNRRVLVFGTLPDGPDRLPDLVLGQPDFESGADNAGGPVTDTSLRWPHGLATNGTLLLVADAGNHRVLEWDRFPTRVAAAAGRAIGQPDLGAALENRGGRVGPDTVRFPYGVGLVGASPLVIDTVNHRALLLDGSRRPAAWLGQHDLYSGGENRWQPVARDSLCWPYGGNGLDEGPQPIVAIADSGNNRILLCEMKP